MTTSDDRPDTVADDEVADDEVADDEVADGTEVSTAVAESAPARRFSAVRLLAFGLLPALALLLGAAAGFLRWVDSSARDAQTARIEAVQAARDSTVAILSYRPQTVDKDLGAARERLTGTFLDAYTQLIDTVVIPGAKQKQIAVAAQVPAAASVSADGDHAVVLVFVDQTTAVGGDAPTTTTSSVRVTLDKVGDRWLISGFDPV